MKICVVLSFCFAAFASASAFAQTTIRTLTIVDEKTTSDSINLPPDESWTQKGGNGNPGPTRIHPIRSLIQFITGSAPVAGASESNFQVTSGNFPSQFTSGNYPNQITAGNYPNQITAANYPDQVTAGTYPNQTNYGTYPNQTNFGTYPNQITSGNYPNQITAGNYPDQITAGNYPNQVTAGNYPDQVTWGNGQDRYIDGKNINQDAQNNTLPAPKVELED